MLPATTGEELSQEIRDFTDVPIIMITAKVSEEERLAGFSLGADDYITKPFSPRELVLRVKAVLKRTQKDVDKSLSFENGRLILNPNTYEVILDNKNADFTPTEFKILYTLAHNPNKVYPRSDIVETALGYTYDGYDRSIDTHIKNIRNKLSKIDETQTFIITVYGIGYKFSGVKDN
jgi:two-component system OmpR family response regulator